MKFLEVKLTNWGPYCDEHVVRFPSTDSSPIIAFNGKNGRGKTSFMRALNFGLYGRVFDEQRDEMPLESLASNEAFERKPSCVTKVELLIEHKGVQYEISREFEVTQAGDSRRLGNVQTLFRPLNGVPFPENKVRERINEILDENISDFYLFDGEKLNEINRKLRRATRDSQEFVQRSVEKALGLGFVDKLQNDLSVLQDDASRAISRIAKLERDATEAINKRDNAKLDIEQRKADIEELQKQQQRFENELAETQRKLQDFASVRDSVVERQVVKDELRQDEFALKTAISVFKENADKAWVYPLRETLLQAHAECNSNLDSALRAASRADNLRGEISVLEDSAKESNCSVCGAEISQDVAASNKTRAESLKAELESLHLDDAVSINERIQKLSNLINNASLFSTLETQLAQIAQLQLRITERETRLREIAEQIGNSETPNIVALEDRTVYLSQKINECIEGKESVSDEIVSLQAIVDSASRRLANSPEVSASERLSMGVIEQLKHLIESSYADFREAMRAQVEEASTLAVRSLSDEPEYDSIAISSSYKISLRKKSGLEVPIPSSGYSQIVAMSFLFGLGWVSGSDNTVVIDTPLGRLDLENRENMLDWIRSRQNQTIIFLQNGELTEAETRNAFAGKLASQIQIERVTSDTSRFVEIGG